MVAIVPRYLLLAETESAANNPSTRCAASRWRFVLQRLDGSETLEVSDTEPCHGERLQLLAVIRGLEAIGQPSHVTLIPPARWIVRALRRDLASWKEMNWMWERFGELHPIKHGDLWRRLDRAMGIHTVQCRSLRVAATFQQRITATAESAANLPAGPRWRNCREHLITRLRGLFDRVGHFRPSAALVAGRTGPRLATPGSA